MNLNVYHDGPAEENLPDPVWVLHLTIKKEGVIIMSKSLWNLNNKDYYQLLVLLQSWF